MGFDQSERAQGPIYIVNAIKVILIQINKYNNNYNYNSNNSNKT